MMDKEVYKGLFKFDKEFNIGLSLFVVIACSIGLFLIADNKTGMTGFSIFERTEIGSLDVGVIFFIILLAMVLVALVNLIYSLRKE